jgi:DNA-directed RNA polymerase I subunit RPA1
MCFSPSLSLAQVAGVLLTARDTFFTRSEYQQLLFIACWDANPRQKIVVPPPAIWKPRPTWTGKQLVMRDLSLSLYHPKSPLPPPPLPCVSTSCDQIS